MRRIIPFIVATLILYLPVKAEAPKQEVPLNKCFLRAKTSGQEETGIFDNLKYETLIKCLAWYESSHRTNVYGDNGRAYGILQFWRSTFSHYCKGNYYNPRAQTVCADQMIDSNWNNIYHWSTAENCI